MHKLAFLLKPYGVRPRQNDARTARGYHAADFADPFRRYLTVQTVQLSAQAADQHERPDSSTDTLPSGTVRQPARTLPPNQTVRRTVPPYPQVRRVYGHLDTCGRSLA